MKQEMNRENILIIEEDAELRESVRLLLQSGGYQVTEADDGQKGLAQITDETDLVILAVQLPGMNGIKVCEEIRRRSNVPIFFVTERGGDSDKMIGLMAGGDDYLVKPFSYAELLGRVKALLRRYRIYRGKDRAGAVYRDHTIERAGVRISTVSNEVTVTGCRVTLPEIEYRMLLLLMEYPDRVFSAKNLYEAVWQEKYTYSCNNTVMAHIRKLRVKIEKNPAYPERIQTIWGKGYRFSNDRNLNECGWNCETPDGWK